MEPKREDKAIRAIEAAIAEVGNLILEDIQNNMSTTKNKIEALNLLHDVKNELLFPYTLGLCCVEKSEGQENGEK